MTRPRSALTAALRGLCVPVVLAAATAVCAAPSTNQYDLHSIAAPTAVADMQRCLGAAADPVAVQEFHAKVVSDDASQALQLQAGSTSAVVLASARQWACVPVSPQGFPAWPAETLHGLIVPVGVPGELILQWRRDMLEQVARDGIARGLIVYPSGDAERVHIIAEQGQALYVKFTTRLLKAGEYSEAQYPSVLRHPGLTRLVTRSMGSGHGTPSRLAIPPFRLFRPVHDDFAVVEPTAPTKGFHFAATRWTFSSTDGQLALLPGGRAVHISRSATGHGHWRETDGVLHVAMDDGVRYALTVRPDQLTMAGIGRRAEEGDQEEDEGGEWQWPVRLRMHGVPEPAPAAKTLDARHRVRSPLAHG